MPRACTICTHPDRTAIDGALVAGTPIPRIGAQYRASEDAIARHAANHLPAVLAEAQRAADVQQAHALAQQAAAQATTEAQHALDVVQQLRAINAATLQVLDQARKAGNPDMQLRAIDRLHKQIELQARLIGELDDRPQVNLLIAPEWLAVRAVLLAALAPYPEARAAVALALTQWEGGRGARD